MSSPCVIARLFGGLGNQLFIYAFSKALAERNGVQFRLDIASGFERDPVYKRQFMLQQLVPPFTPAARLESRLFPSGRMLRSLDRKLNKLIPLERRSFVQERTLEFDPEIYNFRVVRPTVFNGVWQSPRYFDNLDMRSLVRFPDQLLEPLTDDAQEIYGCNSVCLAIRRYEEVRKPGHHILQLDYFNRAMRRIEQEIGNPHYFVFAQDMDWAKENIRSNHPITFAQKRDPYDGVIQDLYLMTLCKHYILSNSSLHWWSAWLGNNENGAVISPNTGWPNYDLIANDWIQIQT